MGEEILGFTASGSPRAVARAIEEYARGQVSLNAIVVPWESDNAALTMAVTSSRGSGWDIEHIDLGTIKLTDLGNELTRVAVAAGEPDHLEKQKLAVLFGQFAQQIRSRLQLAAS